MSDISNVDLIDKDEKQTEVKAQEFREYLRIPASTVRKYAKILKTKDIDLIKIMMAIGCFVKKISNFSVL